MDYNKIFEKKYQAIFQNLENFINSEFKSSKEDDEDERDYQETYNEVRSKLEEWRSHHYENSLLKSNSQIYQYFTSRNNKVRFPEHLFPGVLERKTKKLFLKGHSEADYPAFIFDLAENKAYQDIIDIVNNYDKYFDLVYRGKKWKTVDLNRFDHNYESAEYFLKLHKKIYPPLEHSGITKRKKDYSREIEQTQQRLKSFTEEEKLFLIKVCYENIVLSRKGLDKTEFMKLCQIFSGMEDLSIFYQDAQNSKSYSILKKKYDYFNKLEGGEFLQILINKLATLGLTGMKTEVKIIQSKT